MSTIMGYAERLRDGVAQPQALRAIGALVFAVAMAVGASLTIPLPYTPVPITLQTFVLFVGATLLGRHYAGQMVAWYLGLGALGAPMFAGGAAGWGAIAGPTGGYLLGFIGAALVIGYGTATPTLTGRRLITRYVFANSLIYLFGVSWLSIWLGKRFTEGLVLGCYPFLLGDITKIIAAACLVQSLRRKSYFVS